MNEYEEASSNILMVISSDVIGREKEIGGVLVRGFFETMHVTRQLPHTMFFLNAGVKLTTVDEEVVPILKEIASLGVELYSCGTCLKYYGLEDSLQVGHRGSTGILVEGIQDFGKTVWIG
jgi:selenium metabolism protein YedF